MDLAATWRNRRSLWLAVAASCLIDIVATYVFRVWHPSPFGWGGDFYTEVLTPLKALAHGHILTFINHGPSYLGAVLLEAIFALPAIWLGATGSVTYFLAALPMILAAPVLLAWSFGNQGGRRLRLAGLPLALIVLNPVTLACLDFGHPEDILTACLAIAAVLAASRDSTRGSAVLIALAIIAKPWAVIAAPAVWAISPNPRRVCLESIVMAASFWLPILLIRESSLGSGATSASLGASVGNIVYPEQLLYVFGANSWICQKAHVLIPLAALVLTVLWHRRGRPVDPDQRATEALWFLAFLLLIRAAFDPWDTPYYHLPFLMALMMAEARSARRLPVFTIAGTVLAFILIGPHATTLKDPSGAALRYAVVAVPALILLALRVYGPTAFRARAAAGDTGVFRLETSRLAKPAAKKTPAGAGNPEF